jgi:putative PIN family toxin of toxin-antitoxin system
VTIRAVIDTNVVISGLLSPSGTPAKVINAAGVSFQLVWSPGIVAECLRVIDYPRVAKVLRAARREDQAREVVLALAAGAAMVAHEMLPRLAVVKADPDDDLFLATALAGGASVVVSGDRRHLLPLGAFGGVRITDPANFLVDLDRLASSVREAAAAYAPARSPPVPSLHDPRTHRIDTKLVAAYLDVPLSTLARALGKDYKAVFKSPASAPLQRSLAPIHRTVVAAERLLGGSRRSVLAWLNSPNGELDGRTPLSVVTAGRAEVVANMLEGLLAGALRRRLP